MLNDPGKCVTSWSMIISIFAYGSCEINQALPTPDANNVTAIYPFTCFVFAVYSVNVMNIERQLLKYVVDSQLMNQSLGEAFLLATIQQLSIKVVRVEVVLVDASVDALRTVLAAYRGSWCCMLKQYSLIWPCHWQWKDFPRSFSFLACWLSLLSPFGPLPHVPPLPPFFAKYRASGSSPFPIWIAASFSTSLVTISSGVAVIVAFLSIMSSRRIFNSPFVGIPWRRLKMCSYLLILAIVFAVSLWATSVSLVHSSVQRL